MNLPSRLVESLEPRRLCAHTPTTVDFEQYMIELINRARANPTAEATRQGIALNEGLPANTITTTPKQPLAPSAFLATSARGHTQWMIDHQLFQHEGPNNNSPSQRMADAGYSFVPTYTNAENIAWQGTTGAPEVTSVTAKLHSNLFIDDGIAGRGHRTNIMNPDLREIGVGVIVGDYQGFHGVWTTNDFAASAAYPGPFLTGVAYADTVAADKFYTPGEGLAGITVSAKRTSDGATFTATTSASGAYALQLAAGTYDITASGTGLAKPVVSSGVVISTQNVKQDFQPPAGTPALDVQFSSKIPATFRPGGKTVVTLRLTSTGTAKYTGTLHPSLLFSTDSLLDSSDFRATPATNASVSLDPGKSTTLTFSVTSPTTLKDGAYRLLAADGTTLLAASSTTTHVIAPTVNLVPSFIGTIKPARPGATVPFSLQLKNTTPYATSGTLSLTLSLKRTGGGTVTLPPQSGITAKIKASATSILKRSITLPADLVPGTYKLVAKLVASLLLKEAPTSDNTATSAAFTVKA